MDKEIIIIGALGVVNIPIYLLIGKVLFEDWQGFFDALRFLLTPEIFSMFNGEYWDDVWAELKLGVFVAGCAGCVFTEFVLIQKLFLS